MSGGGSYPPSACPAGPAGRREKRSSHSCTQLFCVLFSSLRRSPQQSRPRQLLDKGLTVTELQVLVSPNSMFSRVGRLPALGGEPDSAPKARCGHTLTALDPENARKLILFGGATALENSAGGGAASAAGIRLAGATNDVHCFDICKGAWSKLAPLGEAPSPRAAHAAAAVGSMVVMQVRLTRLASAMGLLSGTALVGVLCSPS